MTVRAVEGKKPYTGGTAITIDENKVISLNLRDENNLIIYDSGDDEIYVDLQLPDEITPTDAFPVGVTTGRVIVDNGWDANGTIICAKTTSGDNIKILYEDNGTLWIDNGTGTFKQIYFKGDVDAIVQTIYTYINENANVKAFLIYGTEAQKKQKLGDAINYYVVSGKIPLLNMDSVTYTLINAERGDEELGTDDVYTFSSAVNSDTGKYKEVKVNVYSTTPISTTVHSYTVTEHSAGGGGGDVVVSTDTGNELSTGVGLWFGTETDFSSISTPDTNTLYIQYKSDGGGGWTPGVNTVVYYPFTTDFSDQSGNSYDMTGYNSATIGTVDGISCLDLTANNSYLSAVVSGIPQGGQARTESMWVKRTALGTYPTHQYGTSSVNKGDCIWTNNHNEYGLLWSNYGANITGPGPLGSVNARHHVVVVINGSGSAGQVMYVDGVKGADASITINTDGTTLKIGTNWDNNYLNGYMSEFIIENKARTQQEVLDYYNNTKANYGIS